MGFAENALRIYQQAKLPDDINRLEKYYSELRGKFGMMETSVELPKEHVDNMNEHISNAVAQNDERGIIQHFIDSPWYDTIKDIKHLSEKSSKETVLLSMLPTSIVDKFGNTVDTFSSEIEKKEFNFWHTYAFSFQTGTRTMLHFFMEAYKAKKLSYNSVLSYLEGTWYNETIERKYHGRIDASVVSNVRDFLNQIDEDLLEYLDMEDILPTPYGTITLDFEKNNDTISIEIGESKIAFFTDFENKENIKLDGVNYRNSMIPPELRKAFSCL